MSRQKESNDPINFISKNARTVLERRYLKKDKSGQICESPEDMFQRVAAHIAQAEKNYDKKADTKAIEDQFYRLMYEFKFLSSKLKSPRYF